MHGNVPLPAECAGIVGSDCKHLRNRPARFGRPRPASPTAVSKCTVMKPQTHLRMSGRRNRARRRRTSVNILATNQLPVGVPRNVRNNQQQPQRKPRNQPRTQGLPLNHDDHLDPMVVQWSKLMNKPFTAPYKGVYMPLAENQFPCPSYKGKNYAEASMPGATGRSICLYPFPSGMHDEIHTKNFFHSMQFVDTLSYLQSSIFDTDTGGGLVQPNGVAAGYNYVDDSVLMPTAVASNTLVPITYGSLTIPTTIPMSPTSTAEIDIRTFAYGLQLIFRGKLLDTEGAVQFVEQFEHGRNLVTSTITFEALRTDPTYRKKYFADGTRVIEFNWSPNCESVQFAGVSYPTTPPTSRTVAPRMLVRIQGVESGQSVECRVMCFQELTWRKLAGQTTIAHVSPDAVHVMNAIVSGRGKFNDANGKSFLHKEALAHKLLSTPATARHISANLNAGGSLLDTARRAAHNGIRGAAGRVVTALINGIVS